MLMLPVKDGRTMDIPDKRPGPAVDAAENETNEIRHAGLRMALPKLKERERFILERRSDGLTLQQIAEKIGVTRERVRQIELKAIERMRKLMGVKVGT